MFIREVFKGLESLNVKRNDILLMHASFRALGRISYTAVNLLRAFVEYLNQGTLILPALTYENVTENNPCFDVRKTRSCIGYLPEVFRTHFEVVRSLHPTHSVCAVGKDAELLTARHHLDHTPCGENAPFSLLPAHNGKILMLGCGLRPNTSMHAIEELFEPEYLFGKKLNYTIIGHQGRCYEQEYVTHNFTGWEQRYDRISDTDQDNWIMKSKIFEAECHLLDAKTLWQRAKAVLEENSNYFVDRVKSI